MGFCVGKEWWGGEESLEEEEQGDLQSPEPVLEWSSPGEGSEGAVDSMTSSRPPLLFFQEIGELVEGGAV